MVMLILFICSSAAAYREIVLTHDTNFRDQVSEYLKAPISGNLQRLPHADLENHKNAEYYAEFSIGLPEQKVNLAIDTTSAYVWVRSPGCFPCHSSDNSFDVGTSTTYESSHLNMTLKYGEAEEAIGILGNDVVKMGEDDDLAANRQGFVVIESDYGFDNMTADGIIGFGFSQLSPGVPTFMENLKNQSKIANLFFSLYLNDNDFGEHKNPEPKSVLIVGGVNTDYAKSSNSPVYNLRADVSSGYWKVALNTVYFGIDKMNITSKAAIFDTRKATISAPESDAKLIRRFLYHKYEECNYDNQGLIICSCDDLRDYPAFEFQFSNNQKKFALEPKYYFYKEDKKCILLLSIDNSIPNTWHLGAPFLRSYYSVYDGEQELISLYPSKVTEDHSDDYKDSTRWIIVFFVVLLIVICIVMSVFLYLFCCRHKIDFDEHYKPLFTAKYNLPPHYHRTAVRTSTGQVVPDFTPTSRQNRVFPGISSNS